MKRTAFTIPEFLYCFAFLLFLLGSSLAQIFNGIELSLWLMAFAMVLTVATTTLPWLGFRWLKLSPQGSQTGWWVALTVQISSWVVYSLAMFNRLNRNLPRFHLFITLTTLLWAVWLLVFIYSRHTSRTPDLEPLSPPNNSSPNHNEKAS